MDKSAVEYKANALSFEERSASVSGADGLGPHFIRKGLALPCLRDWQRGRCFDLLHRKAGGHVLERHGGYQSLVERVVTLNVGHDHPQHVVDVASHPVKLHHFRHGSDLGGETVKPLL